MCLTYLPYLNHFVFVTVSWLPGTSLAKLLWEIEGSSPQT